MAVAVHHFNILQKSNIFKKKKKKSAIALFFSVVLTTYLPNKVKEVYRKNTICKNLYFKSLITLFVWLIVFLDTCGVFLSENQLA